MVYLIKSSTYYKIGFSENLTTLDKRFKTYKTHCPDFEVIGLSSKNKSEETRLHRLFGKYRRKGTEWFEFPDELIDNVKLNFTECNSLHHYQDIIDDWLLINQYGFDDVELLDTNQIEGELYTSLNYILPDKIVNIVLGSDGVLYLHSSRINSLKTNKLYEIFYNNIKTFWIDYQDTKDECSYSGIIVDDIIFYQVRRKWYGESTNIIRKTDNPTFYNLIKPYIKDFEPFIED